jgi:hypothetical protein
MRAGRGRRAQRCRGLLHRACCALLDQASRARSDRRSRSLQSRIKQVRRLGGGVRGGGPCAPRPVVAEGVGQSGANSVCRDWLNHVERDRAVHSSDRLAGKAFRDTPSREQAIVLSAFGAIGLSARSRLHTYRPLCAGRRSPRRPDGGHDPRWSRWSGMPQIGPKGLLAPEFGHSLTSPCMTASGHEHQFPVRRLNGRYRFQ